MVELFWARNVIVVTINKNLKPVVVLKKRYHAESTVSKCAHSTQPTSTQTIQELTQLTNQCSCLAEVAKLLTYIVVQCMLGVVS